MTTVLPVVVLLYAPRSPPVLRRRSTPDPAGGGGRPLARGQADGDEVQHCGRRHVGGQAAAAAGRRPAVGAGGGGRRGRLRRGRLRGRRGEVAARVRLLTGANQVQSVDQGQPAAAQGKIGRLRGQRPTASAPFGLMEWLPECCSLPKLKYFCVMTSLASDQYNF